MQDLLTARGKELTATIAFRVPVREYMAAVDLARRRGERLSDLVRDAIRVRLDSDQDGREQEAR